MTIGCDRGRQKDFYQGGGQYWTFPGVTKRIFPEGK